MRIPAPSAAAAGQQSRTMTTTLLTVTYSVMIATTAKLSPANTVVTESGQTIMQVRTACRFAIRATMITTRPANAVVVSFIATTPTTMMTPITPTATVATRNVRTAQFTSTTTSPNSFFTVTASGISAWNLRSTRAARTATTLIRFWVSATGLRSIST